MLSSPLNFNGACNAYYVLQWYYTFPKYPCLYISGIHRALRINKSLDKYLQKYREDDLC